MLRPGVIDRLSGFESINTVEAQPSTYFGTSQMSLASTLIENRTKHVHSREQLELANTAKIDFALTSEVHQRPMLSAGPNGADVKICRNTGVRRASYTLVIADALMPDTKGRYIASHLAATGSPDHSDSRLTGASRLCAGCTGQYALCSPSSGTTHYGTRHSDA